MSGREVGAQHDRARESVDGFGGAALLELDDAQLVESPGVAWIRLGGLDEHPFGAGEVAGGAEAGRLAEQLNDAGHSDS